jgi:Holliday junction resolvase RusA-like endonuclease
MAVHLEFIVPGPPISNQQRTSRGKSVLANRRAAVSAAARTAWSGPKLSGRLQATIINFHVGPEPPVDLDNMSKPIFDEMQNDIYMDDRQIRQARLVHLEIGGPIVIGTASRLLVNAIRTGGQFVYVRVEDPESPYPLPG